MKMIAFVGCVAVAAVLLTKVPADSLLWLILLPGLLLLYGAGIRILIVAKAGISYSVNRLLTALIAGGIAWIIGGHLMQNAKPEVHLIVAIICLVGAFLTHPKRSRGASPSVKNDAIH